VRRGSLQACELDADDALRRWLLARRPALAQLLERGTWLDRTEVESFLDLAFPGVDELVGLLEVERLGAGGAYDEIVVDTAPTGHTLRLLATPATFTRIAGVFDLMQEKHRAVAAAFGRRGRADASAALVEELRGEGERLAALLRDATRTRLWWVMLPEVLSIAESERALEALAADGVRAGDVVINRLTPSPRTRCDLCDGRRDSEARALAGVARRIQRRKVRLWAIPAQEEPPRGVAALRRLRDSLEPFDAWPLSKRRFRKRPSMRSTRASSVATSFALRSTRLLIVGGKGGVGKTTCAAAIALAIARAEPARRLLLLSTDPAHSLADVLRQPVGDRERPIREARANITVRELDAAQGWRERIGRYRESIGQLLDIDDAGPQMHLTFDRAILDQLLELAPPGMSTRSDSKTAIRASTS
jgi:arsenite-transporting ATPase